MKKLPCLILLSSALALSFAGEAEAALLNIDVQGQVLADQQPIQAVIVDSNGNTYERTVYFNPQVGGIDIDTSWAGPSASIFFPSLNQSYVWYNGFWVDQRGYYWNNGQRLYLNDPQWQVHWHHYWEAHPHEHWNDRDHKNGRRDEGGFDKRGREDLRREEQGKNRPDFNRRDEGEKGRGFDQRREETNRQNVRQGDFNREQAPGGKFDRNPRGEGERRDGERRER